MPEYLVRLSTWQVIWPFPVAIVLLTGVVCLAAKAKQFVWEGFSFCALGLVVGHATSYSREPAVGAVLPAVLTLMGSVVVVLITNERRARLVSVCVLLFSLGLLVGLTWGSVLRQEFVESTDREEELYRRAIIEWKVRDYRTRIGLDPEYRQCNCERADAAKK